MRILLLSLLMLGACKNLDYVDSTMNTGSICVDTEPRVLVHLPMCYAPACDELKVGCDVQIAAPQTVQVRAAISITRKPARGCDTSCEGVTLGCALPEGVEPEGLAVIYGGVYHEPDSIDCPLDDPS